jgi:hypothetical protein
MKKFIKYLILFFLPIFILGTSLEFLLRKIPNDYVVKKEFLDKNSDKIKVLFLGSSHAFYGINPADFSSNSFNASYISQSLDYDFEILKKYKNHWDKLECIALPVSYFTLFSKLETGKESWRVKNYLIYYGMNTSYKFIDHSEVFSNNINVNARRIDSYYIKGNSNISCSNLGYGLSYNSKNKRDLIETGKVAAKRHSSMIDEKYFTENVNVLKSIIEFAKTKGVKVFLYTPPAYRTYTENLDSTQLNQTINTLINIAGKYDNVAYKNFLLDPSFSAIDFFDADHLDEIGAKKFTCKIDTLINRINKAHGNKVYVQ